MSNSYLFSSIAFFVQTSLSGRDQRWWSAYDVLCRSKIKNTYSSMFLSGHRCLCVTSQFYKDIAVSRKTSMFLCKKRCPGGNSDESPHSTSFAGHREKKTLASMFLCRHRCLCIPSMGSMDDQDTAVLFWTAWTALSKPVTYLDSAVLATIAICIDIAVHFFFVKNSAVRTKTSIDQVS